MLHWIYDDHGMYGMSCYGSTEIRAILVTLELH